MMGFSNRERADMTFCALEDRKQAIGNGHTDAAWFEGRAKWSPMISAVAVGGLIALASACAAPRPSVLPAFAESCRHYATHATLSTSPGGNVTGVRLLSSGAAWIVLVGDEQSPCDATGTIAGSPIPSDRMDVILPNDPDAVLECNREGGAIVGPVAAGATELVCRTVDF